MKKSIEMATATKYFKW